MSACRVAVNEFYVNNNKTSKLLYGYGDPLHSQRYESQSLTIWKSYSLDDSYKKISKQSSWYNDPL